MCFSSFQILSTKMKHQQTLTFHGMLAFQQRQASDRCCNMVLALFCLIPSGIMSTMSCITDALNSRSKCDSTLCFVTVLATPFECRPSNWRDSKLPSQRSSRGVIPLIKNNHTLHPGAQQPQPGPFPTGPLNQFPISFNLIEQSELLTVLKR